MTSDHLADVAAAWVERWLSYGGCIYVASDRSEMQTGIRADAPEDRRTEHQRTWFDGFHTGRWRELHGLLETVPGLNEAVMSHAFEFGRVYENGARSMEAHHARPHA